MNPLIISSSIAVIVAAASFAALKQSRSRVLRLATVLGWAGPLPGAIMAYLSVRGDLASAFAVTPKDVILLGLTYAAFVVPMFGSYCFVVGLLGGGLIEYLTRKSAPKWAQPAAIAAVSALAAVPVIFLSGGVGEEFGRYAMISAAFWGTVILMFRRKMFHQEVKRA